MITSIKNTKVKEAMALKKTKDRKKQKCFLVEGLKSISEISDDFQVIRFFFTEDVTMEEIEALRCYRVGQEQILISKEIMKKLSDTEAPQGIIAVVEQYNNTMDYKSIEGEPLYILCENIQDPGNLGTIIRTADAVNATGIILSKGTVDVYNPKVIRSTMGSIFHIPVYTQVDVVECIDVLKEKGISILAAHLKGEKYHYDTDLTKGVGIVIGNEGNGISEEVANKCSKFIKIPILGKAESLNAAMASGIIMYEAIRQRQQKTFQS